MAPENYQAPDPRSTDDPEESRLRSMRKWIVLGVAVVFFGYLMYVVINPYRGQRFEKIPHGDHVHYVPKDRNQDVPISEFPTEEPEASETITPEGRVVPADN